MEGLKTHKLMDDGRWMMIEIFIFVLMSKKVKVKKIPKATRER